MFLPLHDYIVQNEEIPRAYFSMSFVLWMYVPHTLQKFREVMGAMSHATHVLYQYDEPHIRRLSPTYTTTLPHFHHRIGTSTLLDTPTLPFVDTHLFRTRSARSNTSLSRNLEITYSNEQREFVQFVQFEQFACDVSLIITTLYEGREQWMARLEFVEEMQRQGVNFHLYAPPTLSHLYGYQRMLRYEELPEVMRRSRVVVSLHLGNRSYNERVRYVNERCMMAMACGALLWVDVENDVLVDGVNCIVMRRGEMDVKRLIERDTTEIRRNARRTALRYDYKHLIQEVMRISNNQS